MTRQVWEWKRNSLAVKVITSLHLHLWVIEEDNFSLRSSLFTPWLCESGWVTAIQSSIGMFQCLIMSTRNDKTRLRMEFIIYNNHCKLRFKSWMGQSQLEVPLLIIVYSNDLIVDPYVGFSPLKRLNCLSQMYKIYICIFDQDPAVDCYVIWFINLQFPNYTESIIGFLILDQQSHPRGLS